MYFVSFYLKKFLLVKDLKIRNLGLIIKLGSCYLLAFSSLLLILSSSLVVAKSLEYSPSQYLDSNQSAAVKDSRYLQNFEDSLKAFVGTNCPGGASSLGGFLAPIVFCYSIDGTYRIFLRGTLGQEFKDSLLETSPVTSMDYLVPRTELQGNIFRYSLEGQKSYLTAGVIECIATCILAICQAVSCP